jgi:hypothetical protein
MAFIYDLTDTWSAGGTTFNAIKMNVTDSASAAASKLVTLQVGGSEKFSVQKDGQGYFSGNVGIGTASPGAKLDVTGDIRLSAATPNIEFNSGGGMIYGPAANTLAFATGGGPSSPVERMRINASGNVGIGTASPTTKVQINYSNTTFLGGLTVANTANSGNAWGRIDVANTNTGGSVVLAQDLAGLGHLINSTNNPLTFATNNIERVRIDNGGNVGIGTSAPGAKLDVAGDAVVSSQVISGLAGTSTIAYTFGGQTVKTGMGCPADSTLSFYAGGATERMRIDASGKVGIGTSSPNVSLDVVGGIRARGGSPGAGGANNNGYAFNGAGDVDSGMFSSADGQLEFYTNNSERVRIDNAGRVAIGTTTPSGAARLEVSSTTSGFLPPRMTTAQRDAISSPPNGLMLYNTSTDKLQVRAAGAWVDLH